MTEAPTRRVFGLLELRRGEEAAVLCSAAYAFCLMASYNVLKPLRDAVGTATKGIGWLWTGTFLGCLVVLPPYWAVVARFARQQFIPWVHRFFALLFAGFFFLLRDEEHGPIPFVHAAAGFYVTVSVFNLLVLSQQWGFLADVFGKEQGERLFAWIAAGGTAGGLFASSAAATISDGLALHGIGPAGLIWLAIALLEGATACALLLARRAPPAEWHPRDPGRTIAARARDVFEGARLFARSPYLLAIAAYLFVSLFTASFLYNFQRDLVKLEITDRARQTEYNAWINTATQLVALAGQALLSAPLLRRAGFAVTLSILHGVGIAGLIGFGLEPTLAVVSVAWIALKGVDYSLAKPAREALFTVVSRTEKYQSKSLIDAGLYRGFDMVDGWIYDGLKAAGLAAPALAFLAAPVTAVGVFVSRRLARERRRRHDAVSAGPRPS